MRLFCQVGEDVTAGVWKMKIGMIARRIETGECENLDEGERSSVGDGKMAHWM